MSGYAVGAPESPEPIHKLTPDEVPRAIDLLVRAFVDDPFIDWIVRPAVLRQEAARRFFAGSLRYLVMPSGEVWATPNVEAVALWTPPNAFKVGPLTQARFLREAVRILGLRNAVSRIAGINEIERHSPSAPHYYLFFLGVEPARQGEGIGSRMLQHMLARCDAERMPAYLEATRPALVPFYERHGYHSLDPIPVPHAGPLLYPMWREPVAAPHGEEAPPQGSGGGVG